MKISNFPLVELHASRCTKQAISLLVKKKEKKTQSQSSAFAIAIFQWIPRKKNKKAAPSLYVSIVLIVHLLFFVCVLDPKKKKEIEGLLFM